MRYRLMATYRGAPYEAGIGPAHGQVVLFAACPPPEELGFEPATGHWRKELPIQDVQAVWESRPVGMFRGECCIVLDDLGDRLHIGFLGHDGYRAEQLGYWQVDRGVFELVAARDEVTEIVEERTDFTGPSASGARPRYSPKAGAPSPAYGPPAAPTRLDLPVMAEPSRGLPADGEVALPPPPTAGPPLPLEAQALRAASAASRRDQPDALTGPSPLSRPSSVSGPNALTGPGLLEPEPPASAASRNEVGNAGVPVPPTAPVPATPSFSPNPAIPAGQEPSARPDFRSGPDAGPLTPPRDFAPARDFPAGTPIPPGAAIPVGSPISPAADTIPAGPTAPSAPVPIQAPLAPPIPPQVGPSGAAPETSSGRAGAAGLTSPLGAATSGAADLGPVKAPAESRRRRRSAKRRMATERIFAELASLAAIPASAYSVGEEVDGAMCLLETADGFEVFTSAGGARHEVRVFSDEESACFYLFGVLAADAVRTGVLVAGHAREPGHPREPSLPREPSRLREPLPSALPREPIESLLPR